MPLLHKHVRKCSKCHRLTFREPLELFPVPQCIHDVHLRRSMDATVRFARLGMIEARNRALLKKIKES